MSQEYRGVTEIDWSPLSHRAEVTLSTGEVRHLELIEAIYWREPISVTEEVASMSVLITFSYPVVAVREDSKLRVKLY